MIKKRIAAKTFIEDRKDYIGRTDLVYEIYDIINTKSNNIAIINDDGMGKTSLLNYINLKEIRDDEEYLEKSSRHNTLIVKTNNPEPKNALDFLVTLIKCLTDELKYNLYIDEEIKMKCEFILEKDNYYTNEVEMKTRLYDVFRFLFNEKIGVIYLMDDFDKMVNNFRDTNKNDANDNFAFLRDVANSPSLYKVNYIITCRVPMEDISHSVDVSGLPGIFTQIYMDPLTDSEIEDYAFRYFQSSKMLILRDEHRIIKEISGGLPAILNFVCFHLFNLKVESNIVNYNELLEKTVDSSLTIFESQWKLCSLNEKIFLRFLAEVSDQLPEEGENEIIRKLQRRKILNNDEKFVCNAFKAYVNLRGDLDKDEEDKNDINSEDLNNIDSMEKLFPYHNDYIDLLRENIVLKNEKIKSLIDKINNDEKIKSFQIGNMTQGEKETYNEYVKDMMIDYFINISHDINEYDYFIDKPIAKYWDSLYDSVKITIVEAEKLHDIFIESGYDQSPVGNPYCTAMESVIKNQVFPVVKKVILDKYPDFGFFHNGRMTILENFHAPMIGSFRIILDKYKERAEKGSKENFDSDVLLKIYTEEIINKFENFNYLRNKISHEKIKEEDIVTKYDIRKLKKILFEGKENILEALVKMSEIKNED